MRVRLRSGLRPVWRGPGILQVGLSRRHGTVITGLSPRDTPLIEALHQGIDLSRPDDLAALGDPARSRALLRVLERSGVLIETAAIPADRAGGPDDGRPGADAAVWSVVHPWSGDGQAVLVDRARRHVLIHGAGRLGTTLAAGLAAAGIGTVSVDDPGRVTVDDLAPAGAGPADLGRTRQDVARDVIRRCAPRTGAHPPGSEGLPAHVPDTECRPTGTPPHRRSRRTTRSGPPGPAGVPDLVVLVDSGSTDAAAADPLMSADIPHLSVVVGEGGTVIGPLVRPGRSACLRCLDLHRTDRDPAWPAVLAQLHRAGRAGLPEESVSAGLAAGLAGLQVLAQLDGVPGPAALGATLEVELPDGLVARRPWPVHPACGCAWPGLPSAHHDREIRATRANSTALRTSAGRDEKGE